MEIDREGWRRRFVLGWDRRRNGQRGRWARLVRFAADREERDDLGNVFEEYMNGLLMVGDCGAQKFEPKHAVVGGSGGDAALREKLVFRPGPSKSSAVSRQGRGCFHKRRFDRMGFGGFRQTSEQFEDADCEVFCFGPELFCLLGIGHEPVVPCRSHTRLQETTISHPWRSETRSIRSEWSGHFQPG